MASSREAVIEALMAAQPGLLPGMVAPAGGVTPQPLGSPRKDQYPGRPPVNMERMQLIPPWYVWPEVQKPESVYGRPM